MLVHAVVHDLLPSLAGKRTQQHAEGIFKRLKIRVRIERRTVREFSEEPYAQDGIDEE